MNAVAAISRAYLKANNRDVIETVGEREGEVVFTYPAEYVEGMEFSCSLSVSNFRFETSIHSYKGEVQIQSKGPGRSRGEKMANLLQILEKFDKFCAKCDDDVFFAHTLTQRNTEKTANMS